MSTNQPIEKSTPIKNRLPFLIILSALIALIVYLQWPEKVVVQQKHQRVVAVKTTRAAQVEFKDTIQAIGTARANEKVLITSKYSDLVEEVLFEDGQVVKKGDVLVKLNNQEERAKVKELEANLSESVSQLNRLQELLVTRATSKSTVEQQDAKTKAISAQLLSARTKFNDLTIKAPFAGHLGFRDISVGAYIDSGSIITSLDDLNIIKVDFTVPERFFTTINLKQKIIATNTAYQDQAFIGYISSIDSRIDPTTRTLKVRAKINNDNLKLRPGMLLNINIVRQVDRVLQLPESTIIPIEKDHFVFVIEQINNESIAKRKAIIVGRRHPGVVEVLSGLKEGEQVVIEGALKLRDGVQVKVLEQ